MCRRLCKQTPSEQTWASVFCLLELTRCYLVSRAHREHAACTLHIHLEATPETPEFLAEHILISHQWWRRPSNDWKASVKHTLHIRCLRLLFYVCKKIKTEKKHRILMKYVSTEKEPCFTTVCYSVQRVFLLFVFFCSIHTFDSPRLSIVRFNEGIGCFMKSISQQINLV